jgi:AcrR family transcriptional regulator
MAHPRFDNASFLAAARAIAVSEGPAAVTVDSVTRRLSAPKGSFYYRFASRDLLVGEVWLAAALKFQEGFFAALDANDGLRAALYTPAWVREHMDDARLLMLHSRRDFVSGEWPEQLRQGVKDQESRFIAYLTRFARTAFGSDAPAPLRRVAFALVEVPLAAVKQHIQRGEPPPALVDELIGDTYRAVIARRAKPGRRPPRRP